VPNFKQSPFRKLEGLFVYTNFPPITIQQQAIFMLRLQQL